MSPRRVANPAACSIQILDGDLGVGGRRRTKVKYQNKDMSLELEVSKGTTVATSRQVLPSQ